MGRLTNQTAELPMADFALSETAEIMRRTMEALSGASELPMAKIKVPAGGGKAFEMPGDDGADYAKSFDGVKILGSGELKKKLTVKAGIRLPSARAMTGSADGTRMAWSTCAGPVRATGWGARTAAGARRAVIWCSL